MPWREVGPVEFEEFLRRYPRPLDVRPPLDQRQARFRQWLDPALGEWPDSDVAKTCRGRGRSTRYFVMAAAGD